MEFAWVGKKISIYALSHGFWILGKIKYSAPHILHFTDPSIVDILAYAIART